jgi:RND family efflux transporter MFP subunit
MQKYLRRKYTKGLLLIRQFNELSIKDRQRIYIVLGVALLVALLGIGSRVIAAIKLSNSTAQQSILNVATIKAVHGPKSEEIVFPGSVQAWHQATIFARTNGYIQTWYTDIGARVKTGDLLAKIETPELDAQLEQAEQDLKTAQANNQLAQTTNERWQLLLKTESVSKQDADEKLSSAIANRSIVASARANRDRLRELVNFERVIAPFDGVITARNIDVGDLINEGSGTPPALFQIMQSDKLRVYVKVPQNYAPRINSDMKVELYFPEHPGRNFPAKLVSTADGIDSNTRTLLVEFMAENKDYELLPGGYTEVRLLLPLPNHIVRLPVNTLLFRAQGLQVGTIDKDNKVVLKNVAIGRDFGTEVEIVSGITDGEAVILNPADALVNGQKVHVIATQEAKEVD